MTVNTKPRYAADQDTFVCSHSLTGEGYDASEDGTGRGTPIVVAAPLTKGSASGAGVNQPGRRQEDDVNIVAFHNTQDPITDERVSMPIGRKTAGMGIQGQDIAVRRLTPTECERLQGLPDGWTQLGDTSDSKRYSALGDAVTAPVAEWIGHRLHAHRKPGAETPEAASPHLEMESFVA